MKAPEALKNELAQELGKITENAEHVQAALSEMAALAAKVQAETLAMVTKAADWDQDVRAHGQRITVPEGDGRLLVLHEDQIFCKVGGDESGKLFVNIAHAAPGQAQFREVTALEKKMLITTWAYVEEACAKVAEVGR